ncbi:MAG: DUF2203 domain-containing protein [Gemmatimonadota bacterium]
MIEDEVRFFTVEEANRALPLVRRIVADILEENERLEELLPRLQEARRQGGPELEAVREAVARASAGVEGYLAELDQIGCLFKGAPQGLVDFYARRDGRPVFLCWQYGEEAVQHWHELDAGYAGREPLVPASLLDGEAPGGRVD